MAHKPTRVVEAYSLHGFEEPGTSLQALVDYDALFTGIVGSAHHALQFTIGSDVVAITDREKTGKTLALHFVTGNPGELPLIFDEDSGTTLLGDPGHGRFVVRDAWVFAIPRRRLLFLEKKRPGVLTSQIEQFLSRFTREQMACQWVSISLNPVASPAFSDEIQRFTRIRTASVTLRRPNPSWGSDYAALLGAIADSDAGDISLQANAERGQTLARNRGIISMLQQMSSTVVSGIKKAVVRGTMPGFAGEKTVYLSKNTVRGSTQVTPDADIRTALAEVVDTLAEQIDERDDEH